MTEFLPEGRRINNEKNKAYISTENGLLSAMAEGAVLEAPCIMCDYHHNLLVTLPSMKAMIPRSEGALGIDDGSTRDIALISKVGKPVCFAVKKIDRNGSEPVAILSRKEVQQRARDNYINLLSAGDIIPATVTHNEQFGSFVDIGCGIPSMISIDSVSVSRINHPSDRFSVGQEIYAVVKGREDEKILLTHKELLGTWQENADLFHAGETVTGIIRSVEDYGVFVELTPNLAGLAELYDGARVGDCACVYIKAIIPEKMKIKLIIVSTCDTLPTDSTLHYRLTEGRLTQWVYSTAEARKRVESIF